MAVWTLRELGHADAAESARTWVLGHELWSTPSSGVQLQHLRLSVRQSCREIGADAEVKLECY
jgi:hypothetical protein